MLKFNSPSAHALKGREIIRRFKEGWYIGRVLVPATDASVKDEKRVANFRVFYEADGELLNQSLYPTPMRVELRPRSARGWLWRAAMGRQALALWPCRDQSHWPSCLPEASEAWELLRSLYTCCTLAVHLTADRWDLPCPRRYRRTLIVHICIVWACKAIGGECGVGHCPRWSHGCVWYT